MKKYMSSILITFLKNDSNDKNNDIALTHRVTDHHS